MKNKIKNSHHVLSVLNVNHIINTSGGGGTAERTSQMSYYLANENVICKIITTDLYLTSETRKYLHNVEIHALKCISKRFFIPIFNPFKVNQIVKSCDIIHLMNHWTFINAWIYVILRYYKKPYVVCPAGSLSIFGRSRAIKYLYNFFIGRSIVQNAKLCIAVSPNEIPDFLKLGAKNENIIVIPNGITIPAPLVATDIENFYNKFQITNRKFILFVGRLNLIKGPDLLIKAFAIIQNDLPDYDLILAGPDEGMHQELLQLIELHELQKRVKLIGPISGTDKESAYQQASLLVIPSRKEAMSIVVLEAGIYGTPSVFTDQCGLHFLQNENYGIEVEVNPASIAKGILTAFESESKLKEMKNNLKFYTLTNYNWKNIVKTYINLYKKILISSKQEP